MGIDKREIKFRVFHEKKGMNDVYGIDKKYLYLDNYDSPQYLENILPIENCELMQFTGLIDKRGKEIYEGDIFRSETEMSYGDERIYSVVVWIRERAAFYLIPVDHYRVYLDNDLEDDPNFEWLFNEANLYDFSIDIGLDLCGNIHENPELL